MEQVARLELAQPGWKPGALPLSYTCKYGASKRDAPTPPTHLACGPLAGGYGYPHSNTLLVF